MGFDNIYVNLLRTPAVVGSAKLGNQWVPFVYKKRWRDNAASANHIPYQL
jgi:hypothetical protein